MSRAASVPALVPGLLIGHATDGAARTGCTVLIGPFRAAVHVAGMATGSREIETLSPLHLAPRADAILFTGGSAFGLAAADGVSAWLEKAGRGFDAGVARVPIVPAAVIFDLGVGRADRRPDAALGHAACEAARAEPPEEGAVGAGAGATVGKIMGMAGAERGGFGCWTVPGGAHRVTAAVVLNALGDVRDAAGAILAGARDADGRHVDAAALLRTMDPAAMPTMPKSTNTTLAAVVTDAPLERSELRALAQMAATALPRRITPVHTPFDGDIVFAASTAPDTARSTPPELLALGAVAAHALETAIERAVQAARG